MSYDVKQGLEKVREIAGRNLAQGVILSKSLTELQRTLGLNEVLAPTSIVRSDIREAARPRLTQLRDGFEEYKSFYASFVVNLTREVLSCSEDLPEEKRNSALQPFLSHVQNHVNEQAYWYEWRKAWIDAFAELLDFFDALEYQVTFVDGSLEFRGEADVCAYQTLAGRINEASAKEKELMHLRETRIRARLSQVSNGPSRRGS